MKKEFVPLLLAINAIKKDLKKNIAMFPGGISWKYIHVTDLREKITDFKVKCLKVNYSFNLLYLTDRLTWTRDNER